MYIYLAVIQIIKIKVPKEQKSTKVVSNSNTHVSYGNSLITLFILFLLNQVKDPYNTYRIYTQLNLDLYRQAVKLKMGYFQKKLFPGIVCKKNTVEIDHRFMQA